MTKMLGVRLASWHLLWSPKASLVTVPSANAPMRLSLKRVDACPVLDEVAAGEVRWVVTVGAVRKLQPNNGEINPARYR